jgi:NAD(P)-dependent dehydrogenase (short-subunit alcohol dehydrogenase family)
MRLANKVAVITGGGSGIGRASAIRFAEEGATVVVSDLDGEAGRAVVEEIRAGGGRASDFEADVSNLDQVQAMIRFAVDTYGRLDILFNNAGFPCAGAIEATDDSDFERGMDINLKGAFFASKHALPHMQRQGGGSILFTSSTAGVVASVSSPLYGAAKSALVGLVRSLGARYAPDGIRVNAIAPGPTATAMIAGFASRPGQEMETEQFEAAVKGMTPMRRFAEPSELANAALFLVSDEASYITGVTLPVDGGMTAV